MEVFKTSIQPGCARRPRRCSSPNGFWPAFGNQVRTKVQTTDSNGPGPRFTSCWTAAIAGQESGETVLRRAALALSGAPEHYHGERNHQELDRGDRAAAGLQDRRAPLLLT